MGNWQASGYEIAGNYNIAGPTATMLAQRAPQPIGGFGAGPGSVAVHAPTNVKGSVIGFDSVTDVVKSTSATVTSTPQETFRPERLMVSDDIADHFIITDIKIGAKSQLVNSSNIPAEMFMSTAQDMSLKFDTCLAGQTISLMVSNIDAGADHRFRAGMAGTAAL